MTLQYENTVVHIFSHFHAKLCILADRGRIHPVTVLGAAPLGGPAPEGFSPLSLPERVATQGELESKNTSLLQQGQGKATLSLSTLTMELEICGPKAQQETAR